MRRQPAVAGTFYPAEPDELTRDLRQLFRGPEAVPGPRALALMVPHAGYIYSGGVAAATYSAAVLSRRIVILGPNHTGAGEPIAVFDEGAWDFPFGEVPIDEPLARALLARCPNARSDARAHLKEHSLEVQVPFLMHLLESVSLVPVCVGTLRLPSLLDLGRALADAIREAEGEVLIVMSSDMSHYIPAAEAEKLDRMALERVLAIDPEGLHRVVLEHQISMCGIAPTVVGLEAARCLGAREARLIAYANSGDRSGDFESVVAYAGVAVT
jgi:hypothetical protein